MGFHLGCLPPSVSKTHTGWSTPRYISTIILHLFIFRLFLLSLHFLVANLCQLGLFPWCLYLQNTKTSAVLFPNYKTLLKDSRNFPSLLLLKWIDWSSLIHPNPLVSLPNSHPNLSCCDYPLRCLNGLTLLLLQMLNGPKACALLLRLQICWVKNQPLVHTKHGPQKGTKIVKMMIQILKLMSGWLSFNFKNLLLIFCGILFFNKTFNSWQVSTPNSSPPNHLRSPRNSLMTSLKRSCHFAARLSRQAIRRSWGWTLRRQRVVP